MALAVALVLAVVGRKGQPVRDGMDQKQNKKWKKKYHSQENS